MLVHKAGHLVDIAVDNDVQPFVDCVMLADVLGGELLGHYDGEEFDRKSLTSQQITTFVTDRRPLRNRILYSIDVFEVCCNHELPIGRAASGAMLEVASSPSEVELSSALETSRG